MYTVKTFGLLQTIFWSSVLDTLQNIIQKDASYLNQISGSVVKKLLHYLGSSYRNPIATSIWLHFWHFYHNYALLQDQRNYITSPRSYTPSERRYIQIKRKKLLNYTLLVASLEVCKDLGITYTIDMQLRRPKYGLNNTNVNSV